MCCRVVLILKVSFSFVVLFFVFFFAYLYAAPSFSQADADNHSAQLAAKGHSYALGAHLPVLREG